MLVEQRQEPLTAASPQPGATSFPEPGPGFQFEASPSAVMLCHRVDGDGQGGVRALGFPTKKKD